MKKTLKYTGIVIFVIFIMMLAAPFIFKGRILEEVKKYANENVNATIDFKDVDISFFKSFPEVAVTVKELSVTGIDTFYGQNLLSAKALQLDFSLLPLLRSDQPKSIRYVGFKEANIDIVVLNDSIANYLISMPSKDTTGITFALEAYELQNCNLTYRDITKPIDIVLSGVQHKGSGDIASSVYDLKTSTTADSLTLTFDGFTYLRNVKAGLNAIFHIDMGKLFFQLKENDLYINQLKARGDGSVQFVDDETMRIQADVKTLGNKFGELLSVFPYLSSYNTVKAKGTAALAAKIKGDYNGVKSIYPAFDLTLDIKDGSARYKGLDMDISNVNALINVKSSRPDLKDLEVNINKATVAVNDEAISGEFKIKDGLTDPYFSGNIKGGIRLENWRKALPLKDVEQLQGKIDANLSFDARKSDIDKENYAAIGFRGSARASGIRFQGKGSPVITADHASMKASPQKIGLETSAIKMGKSDFALNGEILHPMAYFSENKNIKGKIKVVSNVIDVNEWSQPNGAENKATGPAFMPDLNAYAYSSIDANVDVKNLYFGNHTVKNLKGIASMGIENLDVKSFAMIMDGSDLAFSGKLANLYSWLTGNGVLNGDIRLASSNLNANTFMVQSSEAPVKEYDVLFKVPADVKLKVSAEIGKLAYTNMVMDNFRGNVMVENQTIAMTGLQAGILGGKIGFDGLYDTSGDQPSFNVKLDLNKMQFNKAFQQFVTMKSLAPVAAYINGVFNTTLVMEGKLGKGMLPDLSSLSASGFIETLNGIIKGFAPLAVAGDKLGLKEINQLELKDTRNWFQVKDGVIEVKEFTKKISGIDLKGFGKQKLGADMDFQFDLRIPRKMLSKNVITGTAMMGLGFLKKEAARLGINIAQGEFIDVRLNLRGRIKEPQVSIKPLGTSGKSMEQEMKDQVNAQLQKAKDSLARVVEKKKQEITDTVRTRAEEELEKAKKKGEEKAEEVIKETKEKVQKEVEARLDTLVGKAVSDTLQKKAEDIIKDKTGKDLEDIKNKVKDWNPFKKKKGSGG